MYVFTTPSMEFSSSFISVQESTGSGTELNWVSKDSNNLCFCIIFWALSWHELDSSVYSIHDRVMYGGSRSNNNKNNYLI